MGVANDFDARIICGLGTTGTNGAGNVDLWGNRFQFVMPSGAGLRAAGYRYLKAKIEKRKKLTTCNGWLASKCHTGSSEWD